MKFIFAQIFLLLTLNVAAQLIGASKNGVYYLCRESGDLYCWGDNEYRQLINDTSMIHIIDEKHNVYKYDFSRIDVGKGNHVLLCNSDGKVYSWGLNKYGQLGIGFANDCEGISDCEYNSHYDTVRGGVTKTKFLENAITVSAGLWQSFAVLSSGNVVAWGANRLGQLGDGSILDKSSPVYVVKQDGSLLNNIVKVSAGINHAYALDKNGNVWAWGANDKCQLGSGDKAPKIYAVPVIDENYNQVSNIIDIAAGQSHGLLLRRDGLVYGLGAFGCSDDSNISKYAVLIMGGETNNNNDYLRNVVKIAVGYTHSAVVVEELISGRIERVLLTWGDNYYTNSNFIEKCGMLAIGDVVTNRVSYPVYVRDNEHRKIVGVQNVALGQSATYCELYSPEAQAYSLWAAGCNRGGQLGLSKKLKNVYSLKYVNVPNCLHCCPSILFDENHLSLCEPFSYQLSQKLNDEFELQWKKDNLFISDKKSVDVISSGVYSLTVTEKSHICPILSDSVVVEVRKSKYTPDTTSFCTEDFNFVTYGTVAPTWYSDSLCSSSFGSPSSTLFLSDKTSLETIIPDSLYRVWAKEEGCQAMPIYTIKNCIVCNPKTIAPVMVEYDRLCHTDSAIFIANGKSVHWYEYNPLYDKISYGKNYVDEKSKYDSLIFIGNVFHVDEKLPFSRKYKLTQVVDYCENEGVFAELNIDVCLPEYTISGNVWNDGKPYLPENILLYDLKNKFLSDQIITVDANGHFMATAYPGVKALKVISSDELISDTWYGNVSDSLKLHKIAFDANIKGLDIEMQNILSVDQLNNTCLHEISNSQLTTMQMAHIRLTSIDGRVYHFNSSEEVFQFVKQSPMLIFIVTYESAGVNCKSLLFKN